LNKKRGALSPNEKEMNPNHDKMNRENGGQKDIGPETKVLLEKRGQREHNPNPESWHKKPIVKMAMGHFAEICCS
jgi:hypothetical protein